jgi:ADP-heptose:LPS heptosyltransferase
MIVHTDCRHFLGTVPCKPHKATGVHCESCDVYDPVDFHILIIKLGAIGDVIRTTPLLHRLKKEHPHAKIWWLTRTPEILPDIVDERLAFTLENSLLLRSCRFDVLLNLDKDREACALAGDIQAGTKLGFILQDRACAPINDSARAKYESGLFDDVSKANSKSYLEEIFEITGYPFQGERYILPFEPWKDKRWKFASRRPIVGLNTGCGGRWTARLWPDRYWIQTAKILKKKKCEVVLLGGEAEHRKNLRLARASGARYFGHYPLNRFINLINQCDLIVTTVTMALHLAIGLEKKIVLFNNIFNRHEFELYGQGTILEPDFACSCYYSPTCENNCMQYLKPDTVIRAAEELLMKK